MYKSIPKNPFLSSGKKFEQKSRYNFVNATNKLLCIVFIAIIIFGNKENVSEIFISLLTIGIVTNLFLIKQPAIFFTLIYHALQATIKVFYAEFKGVSINSLALYNTNANLSEAVLLSCFGIIVLAITINYFLPKEIINLSAKFNHKKLIIVYLIFLSIDLFSVYLGQLSGLFQILFKLSTLKWSVLFLIIYNCLKTGKKYYVYIILFEILIGLFSYFSSFKNVLFVALISFLIINFQFITLKRRYFILFGAASLAFIFAWQTIKGEYRNFLSAGQRSQTIEVSMTDAFDKILDLAQESNQDKVNSNLVEEAIERLSYIDYFAETVQFVPTYRPHGNGEIWFDSIMHILKPRLFFPNKKSIDDSQKTMEYTGLELAGANEGTSISLGYMAESYADFGKYLFVLPIALLGALIGILFRTLFRSNLNSIYLWAITVPFYFQFYAFEIASEKALGAIITYSIVATLVLIIVHNKVKWVEL
jgi:hypothetical protein